MRNETVTVALTEDQLARLWCAVWVCIDTHGESDENFIGSDLMRELRNATYHMESKTGHILPVYMPINGAFKRVHP